MDPTVVDALRAAGIDTSDLERLPPIIDPDTAPDGRVLPLGDEIPVSGGPSRGRAARVRLRSISELWVGDATPPDMSDVPPRAYMPFFEIVEMAALAYCLLSGRWSTDKEFEGLYDQLRRRPDGSDGDPLFEHLQAAARLYMSLRDTSRSEFRLWFGDWPRPRGASLRDTRAATTRSTTSSPGSANEPPERGDLRARGPRDRCTPR